MTRMKPRVLLVHNKLTPFVRIDRDLLRHRYDVEELAIAGRTATLWAVWQAVRRNDVVLCWFASAHGLLPALVARALRRPVVVVVGGYDTANMPAIGYGHQRGGLKRYVARAVMALATLLIANSGYTRDEAVREAGADEDRIRTVYHGISPGQPSPSTPLPRAGEGSSRSLVLTVGNVDRPNLRRKGLEPFVRAASLLPGRRFVVVGAWVDDAIDRLRAIAPPNVTFTGQLSDAQLQDHLRRAAVYVQASLHEGFGMSLAEAMASGCAPVVTRAGALPEVVADTGIYAASTEPADLAAAIERAFAVRDTLGAAARARITTEFTLERRADGLAAAIDEALAATAHRPATAVAQQTTAHRPATAVAQQTTAHRPATAVAWQTTAHRPATAVAWQTTGRLRSDGVRETLGTPGTPGTPAAPHDSKQMQAPSHVPVSLVQDQRAKPDVCVPQPTAVGGGLPCDHSRRPDEPVEDFPFVSVVLPIRNEERTIGDCLGAVLAQDYPAGRMEVLVVDGQSTDRTRVVVEEAAARDPWSRVRLLDNPVGSAPPALNIGIRAARGELIARVDGHTIIAPDYLRRCVETLRETGADNVGGLMRPEGRGYVGRCIALATGSRFGVGNSRFHYDQRGGEAETVYLGCFRRVIFERVGLFDEGLIRNQDDEFNDRIVASGGRIWLDPRIRSTYYNRGSYRSLWRQYYQYGYWKVRVLRRHPEARRARHLVPAALVAALASAALVGLAALASRLVDARHRGGRPVWFGRDTVDTLVMALLTATWGVYGAASVAAALVVASRAGWRFVPGLLVSFWRLHLGYGAGFLAGLRSTSRLDPPLIPRLDPRPSDVATVAAGTSV